MSSSEINVQVGQGILWVGSEAYPLQNIARVQPVKIVPRRGAALRRYLIAVVFYVLLFVAAAVAAGPLRERAPSRATTPCTPYGTALSRWVLYWLSSAPSC